MTKLVIDPETERILGVGIVGARRGRTDRRGRARDRDGALATDLEAHDPSASDAVGDADGSGRSVLRPGDARLPAAAVKTTLLNAVAKRRRGRRARPCRPGSDAGRKNPPETNSTRQTSSLRPKRRAACRRLRRHARHPPNSRKHALRNGHDVHFFLLSLNPTSCLARTGDFSPAWQRPDSQTSVLPHLQSCRSRWDQLNEWVGPDGGQLPFRGRFQQGIRFFLPVGRPNCRATTTSDINISATNP